MTITSKMKVMTARRMGSSALMAGLAVGIAMIGVGTATASSNAAVAEAPAAHSSGTLGPSGYGGVKLGMSAKQAKATGKIVHKFDDGGCAGWDLKAHPSGRDAVGLYISKKRGVALIAAPKGVKTPQGIRIGSTRKQLEKAYPKLERAASGYPITTVPGNRKAYYYFTLSHGKIYVLGLALKNQDCTN
ncbi:hypothetical protein ACOZ38_24945 [Sphaerisporangium viridialbum]|uniref:hypothetical protein n=1 Tax=Sphaerisporangium viridialbum TaxID=46189 RepID=UPI003C71DC18